MDIGLSDTLSTSLGAIAVGSLAVGKILIGGIMDKIGLKWGAMLGNCALVVGLVVLMLASSQTFMAYVYLPFYCLGASMATIAPPKSN